MQVNWERTEPNRDAPKFDVQFSHTAIPESETPTEKQPLTDRVDEQSGNIYEKSNPYPINNLHAIDVSDAGRKKLFSNAKIFFEGAGDKFVQFCISQSKSFKSGLEKHWASFKKWRQEKSQSPSPNENASQQAAPSKDNEIAPQQAAPFKIPTYKASSFFTEESQAKFDLLNTQQKQEFVNRLFAHLGRDGMNTEGVFRRSPSMRDAQNLLNDLLSDGHHKLDSNKDTDIQISAIIKEIYGKNPIFSKPGDRSELRYLAKEFAGEGTHQEKIKMAHDFISKLPQEKQDALYDLLAGLDPIMKNAETKMGSGNLAIVFGPRLAPKELTEEEGVDVLARVKEEQLETEEVNNAIKFIFENHQEITQEEGWIIPET